MSSHTLVGAVAALLMAIGCTGGEDDPSATGGIGDGDGDGDGSGDGDGDGDGSGDGDGDGDGTGDGDGDGDGTPGPKFDTLGGATGEEGEPTDALLSGTVYSPSGVIPISGALVYTTTDPVDGIPDEAYCQECVDLPPEIHWTLTAPDGSFQLPAHSGGDQQFVVQKGQFLKVNDIDVPPGESDVDPEFATLPDEWNPDEGHWIPKIAVYDTYPDKVFNVLAKFGLGDVSAGGELVPGTGPFTLIDDNDQGAFMDDLVGMSDYHIIFVPCASTKYWLNAPTVPAGRAQNIRDYVAAGGKWYATDHSNEYIAEPFPDYQDFHNPAFPDLQPAYDVMSTAVDDDLLAWLDALPPELKDIGGGYPTLNQLPNFETELNYSGLDAVHDVFVQNEEGEDVNVGHHTWVEGPCTSCADPNTVRPMAVSGQYGCGRMMYSTFETSSVAHQGLSPQELVLLYIILEIGVCQEPLPPPG